MFWYGIWATSLGPSIECLKTGTRQFLSKIGFWIKNNTHKFYDSRSTLYWKNEAILMLNARSNNNCLYFLCAACHPSLVSVSSLFGKIIPKIAMETAVLLNRKKFLMVRPDTCSPAPLEVSVIFLTRSQQIHPDPTWQHACHSCTYQACDPHTNSQMLQCQSCVNFC